MHAVGIPRVSALYLLKQWCPCDSYMPPGRYKAALVLFLVYSRSRLRPSTVPQHVSSGRHPGIHTHKSTDRKKSLTVCVLVCSVRINSSKSMIGHLLGGASGVEGVATVLSVYHQRMHPNINLDEPEEGIDMNILVGSEAEDREIEVALSNSFGFGGHNSVVAFRRWRE